MVFRLTASTAPSSVPVLWLASAVDARPAVLAAAGFKDGLALGERAGWNIPSYSLRLEIERLGFRERGALLRLDFAAEYIV